MRLKRLFLRQLNTLITPNYSKKEKNRSYDINKRSACTS